MTLLISKIKSIKLFSFKSSHFNSIIHFYYFYYFNFLLEKRSNDDFENLT